jgi:ElaB/YqjD/DUF883 family membrane-anchored ribosome-binding protein
MQLQGNQMFDNKTLEHAGDLASQAAQSADHAIKTSQRAVNDALSTVRDASGQLRDLAQHTSDGTARYVRNEPVKAMLIAAATGAALMALVSLVSHSRKSH